MMMMMMMMMMRWFSLSLLENTIAMLVGVLTSRRLRCKPTHMVDEGVNSTRTR